MPAEVLGDLESRKRAGELQRGAVVLLDLGADPIEAAIVDDIFQAGPLAIGAVAVVALGADDGFDDGKQFGRVDAAEGGGDSRVGLRLVVGHAHAAADAYDPAGDLPVLDLGDEADVVGENVDRVVGRMGDADLELAGQEGRAIQRLILGFLAGILAEDEDLVVGPRAGEQDGGQKLCGLAQGLVDLVLDRRGGGDDIADDVAAAGHGGQQHPVDLADGLAQVALQDAVELEGLARGDAQRAVAEAVGQLVEAEVLLGGDDARGDAGPDHEVPLLVVAGLLEGGGGVTVVLLVGAVEFEQGVGGVAYADGGVVGQLGGDGAAEATAGGLDTFGGAERSRHGMNLARTGGRGKRSGCRRSGRGEEDDLGKAGAGVDSFSRGWKARPSPRPSPRRERGGRKGAREKVWVRRGSGRGVGRIRLVGRERRRGGRGP